MTIERVGYGAGARDPEGWPNVLRLWLGEGVEASGQAMVIVETNIDDMTGEMLGYVQEKLLKAGAADVWLTPIQMKKSRPGVILSVICGQAEEEKVARLLLRETTTLGYGCARCTAMRPSASCWSSRPALVRQRPRSSGCQGSHRE